MVAFSAAAVGWWWTFRASATFVIADLVVFVLEKLVTGRPFNGVVARCTCRRSAAGAYLIAAARDSLEKSIPAWVHERVRHRWARRLLRLSGAEAYRRSDFATAKRFALEAANGESFIAFSSEYLLSAGASAYENGEFGEAFQLFDDALRLWQSSNVARVLEPKLGRVANSLKWACLHELGNGRDGLPFLRAAAEAPDWTCFDRCEPWLQVLRQAYHDGADDYVRLAFQQARKHCIWWNTELREWKERLRE